LRVEGLELRVEGLGFNVKGIRIRDMVGGFRDKGLGFKV